MTDQVTNLPASIHDRLLAIARRQGVELEYLLLRYANERFLYRLSRSGARDAFVLKGAMAFLVWEPDSTRQSRDIDLLRVEPTPAQQIQDIFQTLCGLAVEDDGLQFDADSIDVQGIRGQTEDAGVRVRVTAYLGAARVRLQIDVGFGDPVSPAPIDTALPTILDFPAPRLRIYSPETVVAEKFEAMVRFGEANTRFKDFYDVWSLARAVEFDGAALAEAIGATFQHRHTAIPAVPPAAFFPEYAARTESQWRAFGRRVGILDLPPFVEVIQILQRFLMPACTAVAEGTALGRWDPSSGWRQ